MLPDAAAGAAPCPSPAVRPFFVFRSETPLFASVFTSNVQIIATTCETSCLALFSPVFRLSGVFALIRALPSVRFAYLRACRPLLFFRPSVRPFFRRFALILAVFVVFRENFFHALAGLCCRFEKNFIKKCKIFYKKYCRFKKKSYLCIRKFIDNVENLETRLARGCNMVCRNITFAVFPYAVDALNIP